MTGTCSDSCQWTSPSTCSSTAMSGAGALLFTALFTTLLESQNQLGNPEHYPEDASSHLFDKYDFIVIGGGSTGSVVASRLSEIPDWNILVIEAGGNPPLTSDIPALSFSLQKTDIDWQFQTEPEDQNCLGLRNKRCNWPRGKVLGGTGVLNGMLYIRGKKDDYDEWANAGNDGWKYDDLLKYFKKSEDFQSDNYEKNHDSAFHGRDGPLSIQRFQSLDITWPLLKAIKEAGYNIIDDINDPNLQGFARLHGTIINGTRCSTAKAFLSPAKNRKNLHVAKYSHVNRILIDPETKLAKAVEFKSKDGKMHKVFFTKEVIVAAGTINSPQLLMLSGIGPKKHLDNLGIKVINDLEVGENLQDHIFFLGSIFTINKSELVQANTMNFLDASYEYLTKRTGFLSTHYGTSVSGFLKTNLLSSDVRHDTQLFFFIILANDTNSAAQLGDRLNFPEETIKSLQEMTEEGDVIMIVPVLSRPKSRGKINLASTNPLEHPKIYPGYLNDASDIDGIIKGIKVTSKIMKTKVMKHLNAKRKKLYVKACENLKFDTTEYWECLLRNIASTAYHAVGTCKMGPKADSKAVVDPQLKIHGVKGIRIADASIMPTIVSTPTYATTIVIGEKVADMIIREWEKT